jgi:hypothetical protein
MTRLAVATSVLLALAACAAPAPMSGPTTNPQLVAHCKLMALRDEGSIAFTGIPSLLITTTLQSNRRQGIFNACLEARE